MAGSYICVKSYTSSRGKNYEVGDIIYWSEYFNLAPGEEYNWRDNEL